MSFSLFVIGPYYKKAGILKVSEQIIINQSLSFIIGLVFGWGLTKLLPFFFPESIFLIGRQKLFHDKKKRLRHTIGTVILLGIAVSLVGAFIFSKISQWYLGSIPKSNYLCVVLKCGAERRKAERTNSVTQRFTKFWHADYKVVTSKVHKPVYLRWEESQKHSKPLKINLIEGFFFYPNLKKAQRFTRWVLQICIQ